MRATLLLLCALGVSCKGTDDENEQILAEASEFAELSTTARDFCCDTPGEVVTTLTVRGGPDLQPEETLTVRIDGGSGPLEPAPAEFTLKGGDEWPVQITAKHCNFSIADVTIRLSVTGSVGRTISISTLRVEFTNLCPPPGSLFLGIFVGAVDEENEPAEAHAVDADGTLRTISPPISVDEDVTGAWMSPGPGGSALYSYYEFGGPEGLGVVPTGNSGSQLKQIGGAVLLLARDSGHSFLSAAGWAPDASRVHYYIGLPSSVYELHTIRPDGTDRQLLVSSTNLLGEPVWSPDSSRLARLRLGALDVDMADGSGSVQLSATATAFAWSPDGAFVAYVAGDALHMIRPDGTGGVQVSTGVTGIGVCGWSPDGSRLAYKGTLATGGEGVFTVQPDGTGHARASAPVPAGIAAFHWSPDSSTVAYTATEDDPSRYELYAAAPDGAGHRKLSGELTAVGFAGVQEFAWAPDGERVAYLATQDTDNTTELYSSRADGKDNVKLSRPLVFKGGIDKFAWLPDGSTVIYSADAETNDIRELYVVLADGSDEMKISGTLPPGEGIGSNWVVDTAPHCPDGTTLHRRIAFLVGFQPDVTLVIGTLGTDPSCPGLPFSTAGCGWHQLVAVDIGFLRDLELGPTSDCDR